MREKAISVSKATKEMDLDGLDINLPDLDTLTDAATQIDSRRMSEMFGAEIFSLSHRETAAKVTTFDLRKVKTATDCIQRLPKPREYIHFVVGQGFAGFDLLPTISALEKNKPFTRLYLTTLGFNRDNIAQLQTLIDARKIAPAGLKVLCADFFRRADSALFDFGKIKAFENGYGWRSFRNHTKLILGKIAGKCYVVESSANLRSCQNIEQFLITQSEALFNFHANWIETIWKEAKT